MTCVPLTTSTSYHCGTASFWPVAGATTASSASVLLVGVAGGSGLLVVLWVGVAGGSVLLEGVESAGLVLEVVKL